MNDVIAICLPTFGFSVGCILSVNFEFLNEGFHLFALAKIGKNW